MTLRTLPSSRSFANLICVLLLASLAMVRADAVKPPDSGVIFDENVADAPSQLKPDKDIAVSVVDDQGKKAIKLDISKLDGYPGVNFPIPDGNWDFTGYTGTRIEVTNSSTVPIVANLKVDNAGDSKTSPWNIDMVTVDPGKSKTLKLTFGKSFNQPGFNLDPAHVTGVRFYIIPTKQPVSLLVSNLKVYKEAEEPIGPEPLPDPVPPVVAPPPTFPPTPVLDISGKKDFPDASTITDDAATQLKGLCTLAEFNALPAADRHVYSFDVWPTDKDQLDSPAYPFNFHLGDTGVTSQKVAFIPEGKNLNLSRITDATTKKSILGGFGNLDWGAGGTHVYKFNKPVAAFAVVLRSSGDFALRRFFWPGAQDNGYPVSYALSDGTVVKLGVKDEIGATIKGGTDALVGVIDHSGRGIVSFTYTMKGLGGNKAQSINLVDLAFVTMPRPATAPIISLQGSYDFLNPQAIAELSTPASGLMTLDDFRFIVANHRYVYDFATWPQDKPDLGSDTGTFSFDLNGKGAVGEKVTVTATNADKSAKLTQTILKNEDGQPYAVLGGLGDIGKGAWAEQIFKFNKPVWAVGVTYSSPADLSLGGKDGYPISYTLSDGTVINFGATGSPAGTISANGKTFIGVRDTSDKGISSITFRVQGTAPGAQPVYINNLAFAIAGPPPGDFKMTMHDEFDGDKLNPQYWTTGYTFPDVINNEYQAYVPDNVVVGNGVATIKIDHKPGVNTDRTGRTGKTQEFSSGAFTSFDKFTQTYGYFEARIKMPKAPGVGLWPAFWVLPDRGNNWPKNLRGTYRTKDDQYGMGSEIDIFEFMPWWKLGNGLFPIHCGTIWSYGKVTPEDPAPHGYGAYGLDNDGWGPSEFHYPNADTEFHTYGLYWSKERLIFYVDSKPIYRVRDAKNIPDVPEYFLFNVAMSGNGWGKTPGKTQPSAKMIARDLPNEMQIDYFRAYSGILDEAIPTAPEDMPVAKTYQPPAEAPAPPPITPSPTTAAPAPKPAAPSAPVNSTINTPSQ